MILSQTASLNTALSHAVFKRQNEYVTLLLRRGARMGFYQSDGWMDIADIDVNVLASYLDECIINMDCNRSVPAMIQMNYVNFSPVEPHMATSTRTEDPEHIDYIATEMSAIEYIISIRHLRHMTTHPLIASYLFLKRCRLLPMLHINLYVYAVFSVALITHILWPQDLRLVPPVIIGGATYLMVRETIKLLALPAHYARSPATYLSLALVLLTIALLGDDATDNSTLGASARCSLSAITILVVAWELIMTIDALSSMTFSTHLLMLFKVTQSLIKSMLVFSIILMSFAMCFHMLLGSSASNDQENSHTNSSSEDQYGSFGTLGLANIRTIVMLTGEFDASSIVFRNAFVGMVFLAFVLFVSIAMFNLLTGLAVSDTQEIRTGAKLTYWIRQAETMIQYERMFGKGKGSL